MRLFREALYKEGFTEISSPKLIAGESEGGSEVFRFDYFGQVSDVKTLHVASILSDFHDFDLSQLA